MTLLVAIAVLAAGVLIGTIGVGGVILVPVLTEATGIHVASAVSISMCGFLLSGIVAFVARARTLRVEGRQAWVLNVAALLGAAGGAWTLDRLPVAFIKLLVAAVAIVSGIRALRGSAHAAAARIVPGSPIMAGVGFVVGCGSAWSGTGGPVMLIPILLAFGMPATMVLPLAQIIQIPIAASATGINAAHGRVDWTLALSVGALLVAGTWAGIALAGRIDAARLRRTMAFGLIAVGLWYAIGVLK